ncbi:hypothetical protein SAMN04487974_12246 [Pelagibacterium luteolum]|uniref:Uncharacterized protein n=1 Tax=Pelagibacterium luteolum TaxID=440168 RepID=A0A1G7ZT76_9HYPH|nr:hypothetical protein SAMN04487974_12246 [Pelagibacterium luteolum]
MPAKSKPLFKHATAVGIAFGLACVLLGVACQCLGPLLVSLWFGGRRLVVNDAARSIRYAPVLVLTPAAYDARLSSRIQATIPKGTDK